MFIPKRVIFEKGSLDTEIGQNIFNKVKDIQNWNYKCKFQ